MIEKIKQGIIIFEAVYTYLHKASGCLDHELLIAKLMLTVSIRRLHLLI